LVETSKGGILISESIICAIGQCFGTDMFCKIFFIIESLFLTYSRRVCRYHGGNQNP